MEFVNRFRASYNWMMGFVRRHGLNYRLPTHKCQENNKPSAQKCTDVLTYLNNLNTVCSSLPTVCSSLPWKFYRALDVILF